MTSTSGSICPADTLELIEVVQDAHASRTPLQIVGGASKQGIGYPDRSTKTISTAGFDRIIDYDPAELVITIGAGTRLSTIQKLLASQQQMLAFEPFDFADLSGATRGASTIGGVVAAGFAGSRRLSAGNVRDHILGFTAVSGRGEQFKAGGRVVKNVTGYDLSKLMCGSWGQLAVLTELTLKVLPRPRIALTLSICDLNDEIAIAAMTRAARSQCEIAAATHFSAGFVDDRSQTLFRLEGFEPSVEARASTLVSLLRDVVGDAVVERVVSEWTAWSAIRNGLSDSDISADVVWRICVPSTASASVCSHLCKLDARYCLDWAGGLIWARTADEVRAAEIRRLAEQAGGHATLARAPLAYRRRVGALHPEDPAVAALAQRVRAAFDPAGILDPQRFATTA